MHWRPVNQKLPFKNLINRMWHSLIDFWWNCQKILSQKILQSMYTRLVSQAQRNFFVLKTFKAEKGGSISEKIALYICIRGMMNVKLYQAVFCTLRGIPWRKSPCVWWTFFLHFLFFCFDIPFHQAKKQSHSALSS